ncbi:hypothetical protein [Blastopirellula marina]|nr:hypothetical protein [Blastopirellula marina]
MNFGSLGMLNHRLCYVIFPIFGFCAGICSGLSTIPPGWGVIAPGFFFGLALAFSWEACATRLAWYQGTAIVIGSTVGFVAAEITSILSYRFFDLGNGMLAGLHYGAVGGYAGGLIVAATLALVIPNFSIARTLLLVPFTGMFFGVIFVFCGIYISDHTPWGHPFDDLVTFPLWQTGVAAVIPFCYGTSRPPTD